MPSPSRIARRIGVVLGLAAIYVVVVAVAQSDPSDDAAPPEGPSGAGRWQRVDLPEEGGQLTLQGALMPLRSMDIAPPAAGRLAGVAVAWGDRVVAGQLLARVSSTELAAQLREAEAAALRLQPDAEADANPRASAELRGAQRRQQAAQRELEASRAREAESRVLFDKGYIARNELEQARREVEALANGVEEATEEVRRVERQWLPGQLRARSLDRANAQARLTDLQVRQRQLALTAPIAGVVMYPSRPEGRDGGSPVPELKDGAPVNANDAVMTIGDTSAFVVRVLVGESEVGWLRKGLPATVEFAVLRGRPIAATVQRVAALARAGAGNSLAPPEFEVEVRLPAEGTVLSPEQVSMLRMGIMARVHIARPGTEQLVQLPLAALQWTNEGAVAQVRTPSGEVERRALKIERAESERALVREGLRVGEEVWMPDAGHRAGSSEPPGLLQRMFGDTDGEN